MNKLPPGLEIDEDDDIDDGFNSALTIPDDYLSASRITKYLRCGEDFRRTYVVGKRWTGNVNTALGKSIHSLIETTLEQMIAGKPLRPLEAALDEASTVSEAAFTELEDLEDSTVGEWSDEVRRIYRVWHRMRAPFLKPVAVEERFEASISGIRVVGIIDIIDNSEGLSVIDTKVVKRKKSDRDTRNSLQLMLYGHVKGIASVGFDSIVKGEIPKVFSTKTCLTPQDSRWVESLTVNVAEAISAGVFPLTSPDSWWCSSDFCPHWSDCRGKL